MCKYLSKALVGIAGIALIGLIINITQNAWWLFGLLFVAMVMEEVQ